MRIFLDTNVLIAACIEEHEHHERALELLVTAQTKRHEGFTSAHAILEMYSAMTRMPRSPRLIPSQAMVLIQENVLKYLTIVALTAAEYAALLQSVGAQGIGGGPAYDALHLGCAEKCEAEKIYTFNVRHFQNAASESARSRIVSP